jgi:hypothetical protein
MVLRNALRANPYDIDDADDTGVIYALNFGTLALLRYSQTLSQRINHEHEKDRSRKEQNAEINQRAERHSNT